MTPGPLAVNAATYVGYNAAGFFGALCATFGAVLPEFVITGLVCAFLKKFEENKTLQSAFTGIRPVTVGLIAAAVVMMGQTVFTELALVPIIIAVASFIAAWKLKLSPIWILIIAAVVGALFCG